METVLTVLAGLGLAAACGFRVFVPLFVAGLATRSHLIHPAADFIWIGSNPALIAFGLATVLEVSAYYVPWLDHALDALASPASVVAGSMLAAALVTDMDPFVRWTLAVIAGGGIAATVQAGTVAARGASFVSTGGISNPLVSTAELGGALVTSAVSVVAPGLAVVGLIGLGLIVATHLSRRRARRTT